MARSHRGFAATLSDAVAYCRAEWVALLDADDWFAADKLTTVSPHLRAGVLILQHWERVVDSRGEPLLSGPHPGGNTSTLVLRRSSATDLLPVTNELFFHLLDDVGHGVHLDAPLTYYRVHGANMTDRVRPGLWQEYLAGVCSDVADRLVTMRDAPRAGRGLPSCGACPGTTRPGRPVISSKPRYREATDAPHCGPSCRRSH